MFKNIAEAEAALAAYIPAVKEMTGKDITLERVRPLMDALGNPQASLRIIHIAGTSGKTSTAYYIASLLQSSGKTVGLTVSPHVDSITERLQINSAPVSEEVFCQALDEFLEIIKNVQPEPSYFELLTAFAYWYFAKIGVDYAVIETGMGGRHDATNIAERPDKVCVITDIGLDHMHILGNTPEEIAAQKAGIIQPGNRAYMYSQTPSVTKVLTDYAASQGASVELLEQPALAKQFSEPGLADLPLYQQRNWLLARAVSDFIARRDGWEAEPARISQSMSVQVPGRMDAWQVQGKTVVMDGAHNEQKMEAFVKSFQRRYPDQKVPILLALKQGKEHQAVLPLLKAISDELIITTFNVLQDLPAHSIDPKELAQAARDTGFQSVQVIPDPLQAFEKLMTLPSQTNVITGSFYLLSCVRPLIIKA